MANNANTTELCNYLRFCDTAGNKVKTGSGNYTDIVIPTNTILAIGGDAAAAKVKILFQAVNGSATDDSVDIDYDISKFGLPFVINEIVKFIQKPGRGVIDICDVNTGFRFNDVLASPAACTINVQD